MSGFKEIRHKIKSVRSTQKITRALHLVAVSKLSRAKERLYNSHPFAIASQELLYQVLTQELKNQPDYIHPYLSERKQQNIGLIVVSTDKGLCGNLNTNLFRTVLKHTKSWENANISTSFCTIGQKAEQFFRRFGGMILSSTTYEQSKSQYSLENHISAMRSLIHLYENKKLDHIYIAYNKFVNAMQQVPTLFQLLPIQKPITMNNIREYSYEPNFNEVLDLLLNQFLDAHMYQALLENNTSEQGARRLAMQSATENAEDMIMDLQLIYNKARQASITQELSEIVAGAAAISS